MSEPAKEVRLVVISGLSGSGKSCAIKCFEDLGFFCVDNLPPQLLPKFIDLCKQSRNPIARAAIGIDIRERSFLQDFLKVYDHLIEAGDQLELLYLQARDEILHRRFSETRRPHPLSAEGSVLEGISREHDILQDLRGRADRVIDTSDFNVHQLKESITHYYFEKKKGRHFNLSLTSFGYKSGIPYDLDLLFDVRFLKNPYFVAALKPLTGQDPSVRDYVLGSQEARQFLEKLFALLDFLLPLYEKEGKSYLTIGIGCTGGRHRSVAIATRLAAHLKAKGFQTHLRHRDLSVMDKS